MNVINHHRMRLIFLVTVAIITSIMRPASAHTNSQALVETPIYNFSLPIFNQHGDLLFKTIGTSAIMDENSQFSVQNAKIILPNVTSSEHTIYAKSEYALIEPSHQYAHSDAPIQIIGNNFVANATQWEFFGDTLTLVAHNNVHVKISDNKK